MSAVSDYVLWTRTPCALALYSADCNNNHYLLSHRLPRLLHMRALHAWPPPPSSHQPDEGLLATVYACAGWGQKRLRQGPGLWAGIPGTPWAPPAHVRSPSQMKAGLLATAHAARDGSGKSLGQGIKGQDY